MTALKPTTETAARLAESIAALPPLPATAQKILTCFGDEFIDADKVTEVVEGDPGICARLLGLANSAYFGLAQPVCSIGEAISRVLGVDTVRSLVLAMAIQQSFSSKDCPAFSVERFWLDSLLVAECCKRIVAMDSEASDTDRDLAYSSGLCHNLGLMALAHMDPVKTNKALNNSLNKLAQQTLSQYLYDEFETDHKIMSAELGRTWSLPEPMVAAYQHRAFPNSHCDGRLALIVAAGVAAVENADLEEGQRSDLQEFAEALGVDATDLQQTGCFGERQVERVQSLASNMTH